MSGLRDLHHDATRRLILDTTQRLVVEVHGWTLSMAEVAERSGVSRRTLYRYFPTKQDLLTAASEEWGQVTDDGDSVPLVRLEDLEPYLAAQWRTLAAELPAVMAQHQSPAGREMRQRWLPRARALGGRLVEHLDLSEADRDEVVDVVIALLSSSTFLEMVVRMGHDPERAATRVTWAVGAILDRAQHAGGGDNGP